MEFILDITLRIFYFVKFVGRKLPHKYDEVECLCVEYFCWQYGILTGCSSVEKLHWVCIIFVVWDIYCVEYLQNGMFVVHDGEYLQHVTFLVWIVFSVEYLYCRILRVWNIFSAKYLHLLFGMLKSTGWNAYGRISFLQ